MTRRLCSHTLACPNTALYNTLSSAYSAHSSVSGRRTRTLGGPREGPASPRPLSREKEHPRLAREYGLLNASPGSVDSP